jgi:hypothetical protein
LQAELEQPMFLRKVNPFANCKNDGEIDTANGQAVDVSANYNNYLMLERSIRKFGIAAKTFSSQYFIYCSLPDLYYIHS